MYSFPPLSSKYAVPVPHKHITRNLARYFSNTTQTLSKMLRITSSWMNFLYAKVREIVSSASRRIHATNQLLIFLQGWESLRMYKAQTNKRSISMLGLASYVLSWRQILGNSSARIMLFSCHHGRPPENIKICSTAKFGHYWQCNQDSPNAVQSRFAKYFRQALQVIRCDDENRLVYEQTVLNWNYDKRNKFWRALQKCFDERIIQTFQEKHRFQRMTTTHAASMLPRSLVYASIAPA